MEISKTFHLQAAHRLPNVPPEHPCSRMHGHNFRITVWFAGPLDPAMGWVVDFDYLKRLWDAEVHDLLDHRTLNDEIPNPTSELICGWIYTKLQNRLSADAKEQSTHPVRVTSVEVSENEGCSARLQIEASWQAHQEALARNLPELDLS